MIITLWLESHHPIKMSLVDIHGQIKLYSAFWITEVLKLFWSLSRTETHQSPAFKTRPKQFIYIFLLPRTNKHGLLLNHQSDNIGGQKLEVVGSPFKIPAHFHTDYPESCCCLSWHGLPAELDNGAWTNKNWYGWHYPRAVSGEIYIHMWHTSKTSHWLRNT